MEAIKNMKDISRFFNILFYLAIEYKIEQFCDGLGKTQLMEFLTQNLAYCFCWGHKLVFSCSNPALCFQNKSHWLLYDFGFPDLLLLVFMNI